MQNSSQASDVIIADTQLLVVEGLKALLNNNESPVSFSNIYVAASKNALLKRLGTEQPSLLIMDYCLLDFENYADLRQFTQQYFSLPVIILTNNLTRNDIMELNNCGIRNILHKSADREELFDGIQAALKGRKYYSGLVLDLLMESAEKKAVTNSHVILTASEIDIVRLIAEGLTNKEIANKKNLSIHTIMTHRKNILRKLGASNASEMIMFAIKSGIIDNIEYHI
jgi:DNA-binding NarL/FixJ family response regulator